MYENMKRLDRNEPCPCGSGKKYKKCCWNKAFQYIVDEDGKIFRQIEVKEKIVDDILEKNRKRFEMVFDRKVEPDDPVFPDTMLISKEKYKEVVTEMLTNINVPPQIIYAFNKLDYTITQGLEDRFTSQQLKDWKEAIREYHDIQEGKKKIEIPELIANINNVVGGFENMKLTYALIINKFNKIHKNSSHSNELKEYCFFIITRNLKTIESVELLINNHFGEDALNLIRSIYENYLQILMAVHAPQQMLQEVEAKKGLLMNTYVRQNNSFTIIQNKDTGENTKLLTGIQRARLNPETKEEDLIIYKYLYYWLSSYTHSDISILGNYVDNNGFSHLERNFTEEANIYLCYVNLLIFSELLSSDLVTDKMKVDLKTYSKRVLPWMKAIFQELIQKDENLPVALFHRLEKINIYD